MASLDEQETARGVELMMADSEYPLDRIADSISLEEVARDLGIVRDYESLRRDFMDHEYHAH